MIDTINDIVQYETRGGKSVLLQGVTIKRKTCTYKNPALLEIASYSRKVDQFQKLCAELGFNQISLKVVDKTKNLEPLPF